jgi:hypothetical protein
LLTLTALALALAPSTALALPATAPVETWQPDGAVTDVLRVGDQLLITGSFTHVGPPTGSAVIASRTDASVVPGAFPRVEGDVTAVTGDGTGGWYVAGNFQRIGGAAVGGLAHVRADGTVDPAFDPRPEPADERFGYDNLVTGLAVAAGKLFVVGSFVSLGGADRNGAGAVDATTGALTPWDPHLGGQAGRIVALGGRVYLGGGFVTAGDASRNGLAAFDATSEALLPWDPAPNSSISALQVDGGQLLVAGFFTRVGGADRSGVAELDPVTGQAQPFQVPDLREAFTVAVDADTLYIAGRFGDRVFATRAIRKADGSTRWSRNEFPSLLAVDGGRLIETLPSVIRTRATSNGARIRWAPAVRGADVFQIVPVTAGVLLAGGFATVGGEARQGFAAIDLGTGRPLPVSHRFGGGAVTALDRVGGRIYLGGGFTSVDGRPRARLAVLDRHLRLTGFRADVPGRVSGIAVVGRTIALTGNFGRGKSFRSLLAVDAGSGRRIRPWGTKASQFARAVRAGRRLYAVGFFVGGGSRVRELDPATGRERRRLTGGHSTGFVNVIAAARGRVFLGGGFTRIDGHVRRNLAAVTTNGHLTSWRPSVAGFVDGIAATDEAVYVSGSLAEANGQAREGLAAFDPVTGALLPWLPLLPGGGAGAAVAVAGDAVVVRRPFGFNGRGAGLLVFR